MSADLNPQAVQDYLETEIKNKRVFGPFIDPPFEPFQCNPIGIVPKKTPGKFRSIVDLSYLL